MEEMRSANSPLRGAAFFDAAKAEMESMLGGKSEPRGDKVEGARNGGGDEGGAPASRRGQSYANMPADARRACDDDARRFVGATKRFKTEAEWRSNYAQIYFNS